VLTITGLMRSGTSAAAAAANRAGVTMGTTMVMPAFGLATEWEDAALVLPLTARIMTSDWEDVGTTLAMYVQSRIDGYKAFAGFWDGAVSWGVKSPFLMLCWDAWSVAAPGDDHIVAVTSRRFGETIDSMHRAARNIEDADAYVAAMSGLQGVLRTQYERVREEADFVIENEDLLRDPDMAMAPVIEAMR
jgi:hypothetical protein